MFKSSYDCVDIYDRNALDLNRYRLHSSTVDSQSRSVKARVGDSMANCETIKFETCQLQLQLCLTGER
jgi:hypothetical protein